MANKKLNQLVTKPSIGTGDLFPLADATTGQLYKTTISALGTAIGSGVSSVNTLVGAVVLDTDDIQELASPVNKWFTDLRARAAISAGTGISYSSSTGVIASTITQYTNALARTAISLTTTGSNGSATYDNTTGVLNVPAYTLAGLGGQPLAGNLTALAGLSYSSLGFIKMTGVGTLALDTNSYYLASNPNSYTANLGTVTSVAALTLGTTGTDLSSSVATGTTTPVITLNVPTASATNRGVLSSTDWTTFNGKQAALSGTGFVKISGTTISYDNSTYVKGSGTATYLASWSSTANTLTDSFISFASNITTVEGMGLSTLNGLNINGNYGAGGGGLKLRSYDETTGNAYIDFASTGGRFYLGLNRSTASGLMTNATAYATVLTTGLGTTNLEFGTNATKRLTIDGTTGAATFTSTITATGATLTGALSGTSATFSGAAISLSPTTFAIGSSTATDSNSATFQSADNNYLLRFKNAGGTSLGGFYYDGTNFIADQQNWKFGSKVGIGNMLYVASTSSINAPSSGKSIEMVYRTDGSNDYAFIQTYDRTNSIFKPLRITSSALCLNAGGEGGVGIGTTSPNTLLTTNQIGTTGYFYSGQQSGTEIAYWYYSASEIQFSSKSSTRALTFLTTDTERMRITSGGAVCIGTTSPASGSKLTVTGGDINLTNGIVYANGVSAGLSTQNREGSNLYIWIGYNAGMKLYNDSLGFIGTFAASTGIYTPTSDINKKKDFELSNIGLNEVLQLKPTFYRMKSDNSQGMKELGFLAQEVKEVIPNAYVENEGFIGLNFNPIVAALTKAVQELKAELDTLKNK